VVCCAATANRRQGLVRMIECAARCAIWVASEPLRQQGLGDATIAITNTVPGYGLRRVIKNPALSAAWRITTDMRLDDELRGRRATRPDTPRIITDRERQRIHYHARDLVDARAMTTLANCRTRAKLRGITCTLTLPDLIELLIESDLACPILNIPLRFGRGAGYATGRVLHPSGGAGTRHW
jgi:hypothetical protein